MSLLNGKAANAGFTESLVEPDAKNYMICLLGEKYKEHVFTYAKQKVPICSQKKGFLASSVVYIVIISLTKRCKVILCNMCLTCPLAGGSTICWEVSLGFSCVIGKYNM